MTRASNERGFSLVETLIALAIIAGMTGVAYRTLSQTAQVGTGMTERRDALLVAQSVLDMATSAGPAVSASSGQSGRMTWRIDAQPFEGEVRRSGPAVEEVIVSVAPRAGGKALVTLSGLRLAR